MSAAIGVALSGAAGRMGRAIVQCLESDETFRLVGAIDRDGHSSLAADAGTLAGVRALGVALRSDFEALDGADVVIDFSAPEQTARVLDACRARKIGAVIGTTGLDPRALEAADALAAVAPVLIAPNTSVGVAVLARLVAEAASILADFDIEIVEMHHRHKVDAPSGTALRLARAAAEARGVQLDDAKVTGREGRIGARKRGEIGVLAMRGGDVIGDHTVVLADDGERIELTHKATSRALFARGALRAARWIAGRAPGLYTMEDVIALRG